MFHIFIKFCLFIVSRELAKCTIEILEGIVAWGTPSNSQTAEQVCVLVVLIDCLNAIYAVLAFTLV